MASSLGGALDFPSFVRDFDDLTAYYQVTRKDNTFINLLLLDDNTVYPGQVPAVKRTQYISRKYVHTKQESINIYRKILAWVKERINHFNLSNCQDIQQPLSRLYFIAMWLSDARLINSVKKLYEQQFPNKRYCLTPEDQRVDMPMQRAPLLSFSGLNKFSKGETVIVRRSSGKWQYGQMKGYCKEEKDRRYLAFYKDPDGDKVIRYIADYPLGIALGKKDNTPLFHLYYFDERVKIGKIYEESSPTTTRDEDPPTTRDEEHRAAPSEGSRTDLFRELFSLFDSSIQEFSSFFKSPKEKEEGIELTTMGSYN